MINFDVIKLLARLPSNYYKSLLVKMKMVQRSVKGLELNYVTD